MSKKFTYVFRTPGGDTQSAFLQNDPNVACEVVAGALGYEPKDLTLVGTNDPNTTLPPDPMRLASSMTYRQWLVGQALVGLAASDEVRNRAIIGGMDGSTYEPDPFIGRLAVAYADAALKAEAQS